MILSLDPERNRITLSTKKLEPTPGDMLRDPQKVYEQADDMAAVFKGRLREAEDQVRDLRSSRDHDMSLYLLASFFPASTPSVQPCGPCSSQAAALVLVGSLPYSAKGVPWPETCVSKVT